MTTRLLSQYEIERKQSQKLLTRDQFREGVFERDEHKCVICGAPAVDAHHILERRLWPDGGYYYANGASVCEEHHLQAERTTLSCDALREAAGIEHVVLPPHLYRDQPYDKWGNPILPNGQRLRGELFLDESVQKILGEGNVLGLFSKYVKYPRTYHLPWSPGQTKDDRAHADDSAFVGKDVVVTLKMDGENTTMYNDYVHARSLTMEPHPSRNRVKAIHAALAADIPDEWRICGENLTAVHSIKYEDLKGYFLLFSVWNEKNVCLNWEETLEWAALLNVPVVPELYKGPYERKRVEEVFAPFAAEHEGYVIRLAGEFPYSAFRTSVGKYVRKDHVQTHGHWFRRKMELNGVQE